MFLVRFSFCGVDHALNYLKKCIVLYYYVPVLFCKAFNIHINLFFSAILIRQLLVFQIVII